MGYTALAQIGVELGCDGAQERPTILRHDEPVRRGYEAYPHLWEQVTEQKVLDLFRHKGATHVARYALPNPQALNFVIDNALEGGVNSSLCQDLHGKTLSFLLLGELSLTVPLDCIPQQSRYRQV